MTNINETTGAELSSVGPNPDIPSSVIDMLTAQVQKMVTNPGILMNLTREHGWLTGCTHRFLLSVGDARQTTFTHPMALI